jgi:hypothetical protein
VFDTPVDRRSFLLAVGALVVSGCSKATVEGRNVDGTTRIGIAAFPGVEELDFAGPYEVLTSWAFVAGTGVEVKTVGESVEPVRAAHGLKLVPDVSYADVGRSTSSSYPAATRARRWWTNASSSACGHTRSAAR